MATGSLTSIALLFMVDVLFISNFLFIRKLRSVVDDRSFQNEDTVFNAISKKFSANPLVVGFKGFGRGFHQARKEENMSETEKKKGTLMEVLYAVMLGRHRMAPCVDKRFPSWKPIPFRIGIWSTAITILAVTFLLSENSLTNKLAVATGGNEGGFCATEDAEQKLALFQLQIRSAEVTNIDEGRSQHYEIRKYKNQLLRDTARYSKCPEKPFDQTIKGGNNLYTNTLYSQSEDAVDKFGADFFPGYWRALLQEVRKNGCSVRKKVCGDDWGFGWFCKTITESVPCSPSWEGEIDEDLQADEVALESDANVDELDHLKQESAELVQRLLKQFDVAGTMYSIYMVVALFFPTPMVLYKPSIINTAKGLLFGVRKYTFIITVLVIYWVSDYANVVLSNPEIHIFLRNIVTDPCFLDADFIRNRTEIVSNTCKDLIDIENKVGMSKFEISQTIEDITHFQDKCACPFPADWPPYFDGTFSNLIKFGFEQNWRIALAYFNPEPISSESSFVKVPLWKAKEDFAFLGNETICVDRLYAQNKIMVADDTGLSWWELWISSGLLAGLVVKFFIANFGISLVKLADPFFVHDGKYESPPTSVKVSEEEGDAKSLLFVNEEITQNKIAALKAIAFREVIVWGVLTNLCLISLFIASMPNMDKFSKLDMIVTSVILAICVIGPIGCYCFSRYVNKVVHLEVAEFTAYENATSAAKGAAKNAKSTAKSVAKNAKNTATNVASAVTKKEETKLGKVRDAITPLRKKKNDTVIDKMTDAATKVMANVPTPAKKKDETVMEKVTDAANKVMSTPLRKKKDETIFEKMNDSATKMMSALKFN